MAFALVPFMFFWNLYGNFMIEANMFKVEASSTYHTGTGTQPMIVDPCADGSCIPGTIINGTIANHTVTIKEDENGKVIITTYDDEDNDKTDGSLPYHIKEITIDDYLNGNGGYPKSNLTMPDHYPKDQYNVT